MLQPKPAGQENQSWYGIAKTTWRINYNGQYHHTHLLGGRETLLSSGTACEPAQALTLLPWASLLCKYKTGWWHTHSLLSPGTGVIMAAESKEKCGKISIQFFFSVWKQSAEDSALPNNTQSVYVLERHIIFMQCLMADRCFSLIINLEQSRRLLETNEWSSPKGLDILCTVPKLN